jgi:hypothetical protein
MVIATAGRCQHARHGERKPTYQTARSFGHGASLRSPKRDYFEADVKAFGWIGLLLYPEKSRRTEAHAHDSREQPQCAI